MLRIEVRILSFSYRNPLFLTSSPSFLVPPPTAIFGLLAAILGIGENGGNFVKLNRKKIKKEIQEKIETIKIYFSNLPTVYEFGINRINADKSKHTRSITTVITYSHAFNFSLILEIEEKKGLNESLEEKLKNAIRSSISKFTPYLGSSENLIKEIRLIEDEEEFRKLIKWELVKQEEFKEKLEGKSFYYLRLPSEYDEEGNWIFKDYILVERS